MRKNLLLIVSALACGLILTNCGGGGGGSSTGGGSKLKKNDYLGNIPALYENYNAEKADMEKKIETEGEKLMAGGEKNSKKMQKLFNEHKAKEEKMKEEFQAAVKAEMEKILGKEIPVSYSDNLKNSNAWYFDGTAKIVEHAGIPRLSITLTAKDDFTVPSMGSYDYSVYFRLVGKDGELSKKLASTINPIKMSTNKQSFTKGDVLIDSYEGYGFSFNNYAADMANFAGIEFITQEEYRASR